MTAADENKPRRKSGSETRQRQGQTLVRFSADERAIVDEAASRAGITPAGFARAAALTAANGKGLSALPVRSVRRPPVEKELLAKTLGQLGKVGSNLNQGIAALNEMNLDAAKMRGLAQVLADLPATLEEVREAARAIMQAMGRQP